MCELPGNGAELGAVEEGNTANRGCCIQHVCGCVSGADMPQHTTYSNKKKSTVLTKNEQTSSQRKHILSMADNTFIDTFFFTVTFCVEDPLFCFTAEKCRYPLHQVLFV